MPFQILLCPSLIMIECTDDSDCNAPSCEYCTSGRICSTFLGKKCHSCGIGDGDCSNDQAHCSAGLICGVKNFLTIHPSLVRCPNTKTASVCIEGSCLSFEYAIL